MCNCGSNAGTGTVIVAGNGVTVSGSGTASSPFKIDALAPTAPLLQVRDSDTVDLLLYGTGTLSDPYTIKADTASAAKLVNLGDVASNPAVSQGRVPLWMGSSTVGSFQLTYPGTRITTSTTRGNGLDPGEVARDTDTGKRWEWDGTQWLTLDVSIPAADTTTVMNAGSIDATTDWNTLSTRSGIYKVTAISASNNSPQGLFATAYPYGVLTVQKSGDGIVQTYATHSSNGGGSTATGVAGQLFVRTKFNAGDWTNWIFVNGDTSIVAGRGTIGTSTNWNSLIAAGTYNVNQFGTGAPSGAYNFGTLVVFNAGAYSVTQVYYPDNSGDSYTRTSYSSGTAWGSWSRYARADELSTEITNRASDVNQVRNSQNFDIARITHSGYGGGTNSFWQGYMPATYYDKSQVYSKSESDSRFSGSSSISYTLANASADGGGIIAWKVGRVVTVSFQLKAINSGGFPNGGSVLFYLGCNPVVNSDFDARSYGNNTVWLSAQTDGAVAYRAGGSGLSQGEYINGTASFVVQ